MNKTATTSLLREERARMSHMEVKFNCSMSIRHPSFALRKQPLTWNAPAIKLNLSQDHPQEYTSKFYPDTSTDKKVRR
jgi:hypothetical protein